VIDKEHVFLSGKVMDKYWSCFFLFVASISAGKLLPYQDYLLFKPSGFERTKAFLQQKSDSSFCGNSSEGTCGETALDEDSCLTAAAFDISRSLPVNADISVISASDAECIAASALQDVSVAEPAVHSAVDTTAEMPDEHASASAQSFSPPASGHGTGEVSHASSTLADCDQMSADNRRRVSEFFSHSRLHHISTWGAEYKAYVARLQTEVDCCICDSICSVWLLAFDCVEIIICFVFIVAFLDHLPLSKLFSSAEFDCVEIICFVFVMAFFMSFSIVQVILAC